MRQHAHRPHYSVASAHCALLAAQPWEASQFLLLYEFKSLVGT